MPRKKYNPKDLDETEGPMNDVAKADALAYANAPKVKHLSNLPARKEREVRAKKQQIKKTTTKNERRMRKQILKNIDE